MKMGKMVAVTGIVLFAARLAWAGPFVPHDIGADAKWFGHINLEAVRSLKLVQDLKDKCPAHQRWEAVAKEMAAKLGMNPMEDVLGVTLYSNHYDNRLGVALLYVRNLDRQKVLSVLKEQHPKYKTSEYGSRTLYAWKHGHRGKKVEMTGAFASDSLVVMGVNAEQVKAALDVLDNKKPGLAKDAPLLQGIPETALIAARGIDVPEDYRKTTTCPVLPYCKAATVFWTAKDGEITGNYEITAASEAAATNLKKVVEFQGPGRASLRQRPRAEKANRRPRGGSRRRVVYCNLHGVNRRYRVGDQGHDRAENRVPLCRHAPRLEHDSKHGDEKK